MLNFSCSSFYETDVYNDWTNAMSATIGRMGCLQRLDECNVCNDWTNRNVCNDWTNGMSATIGRMGCLQRLDEWDICNDWTNGMSATIGRMGFIQPLNEWDVTNKVLLQYINNHRDYYKFITKDWTSEASGQLLQT